jgi:plasmid stabilization system protein ParE
VAARTREVVWAASARDALDEVLSDITANSPDGAIRVLVRALDTADSLTALAERGRVVPETLEPTARI